MGRNDNELNEEIDKNNFYVDKINNLKKENIPKDYIIKLSIEINSNLELYKEEKDKRETLKKIKLSMDKTCPQVNIIKFLNNMIIENNIANNKKNYVPVDISELKEIKEEKIIKRKPKKKNPIDGNQKYFRIGNNNNNYRARSKNDYLFKKDSSDINIDQDNINYIEIGKEIIWKN